MTIAPDPRPDGRAPSEPSRGSAADRGHTTPPPADPVTGSSRSSNLTRGRIVTLLALTLLGLTLLWLNRSPWWGWLIVAATLALVVIAMRQLPRRPRLLVAAAWLTSAALVGAAAILAYPPAQARPAVEGGTPSSTPVQTTEGAVAGVLDAEAGVEAFAGIPYAQPPVGDLRWRAPLPPEPRDDVFVADRFSDVAMQGPPSFLRRAFSQVVTTPLARTFENPFPMSEDSLTLNLWRSAEPATEPLPILVYIHGGGFRSGSGALPVYDGAALASRGEAIVVTINYRLGVFGYLSHPDLANESPDDASGNYGTLDQLAALQWLDDNAAAFNGDPERITIAGESAGGEAVCILGATPLARGLVDGIIGESGACMGTTGDATAGDQTDTRANAEAAGRQLTESLGGASIDEMREMSATELQDASADLAEHWRPSIDGHVLNRSPVDIYTAGDQLDVPLLLGSNADESSLGLASPFGVDAEDFERDARETYGDDAEAFLRLYPATTDDEARESQMQADTDRVMTAAMHRWATLQTESGSAPAHLYFFAHTPPDPRLERYGAYHGAEVMYAYDNLGADDNADYGPVDYALRDEMTGYWLNFVRTGDPNGDDLPAWPTVEAEPEQVMTFDRGSRVTPRPRPDAIDFWMRYEGPVA